MKIGFIQPLLDENEESNSQKIKENIIGTRKDEDSLRSIHSFGDLKTANIVVQCQTLLVKT